MDPSDTLQALADAWRRLHPRHELDPAQREELAQRTAECLAYFTDERTQQDHAITDLSLARAIRLCERLARAIHAGAPLSSESTPPPPPPLPEPATTPALAATESVHVELRAGLGSVVELRGQVTEQALSLALEQLARELPAAGGALLVDARMHRGHEAGCAAVLAGWVAERRGMALARVAVVVGGRAQFVRASRALAKATGIAWLITQDRGAAERWMTERCEETN